MNEYIDIARCKLHPCGQTRLVCRPAVPHSRPWCCVVLAGHPALLTQQLFSPLDHMSTPKVYRVDPSRISGALQQAEHGRKCGMLTQGASAGASTAAADHSANQLWLCVSRPTVPPAPLPVPACGDVVCEDWVGVTDLLLLHHRHAARQAKVCELDCALAVEQQVAGLRAGNRGAGSRRVLVPAGQQDSRTESARTTWSVINRSCSTRGTVFF